MIKIPSPLQQISWSLADQKGVELWIKRDDLIHPQISGNKWRKLLYNVELVKQKGYKGILTFGGAFSNHIAATAFAGKYFGIPTVGIIRGEEADLNNPTLAEAHKNGMEIIPVTREEYKTKETDAFLEELALHFPNHWIVPEGGSNLQGVIGCMDILSEVNVEFDQIFTGVGTATTLSGIVASATGVSVTGVSALKGGGYLRAHVNNFLQSLEESEETAATFRPSNNWNIEERFHCGGFGKVNQELVEFMNAFFQETRIPLDPVYTSKVMFGVKKMLELDEISRGQKLLVLHTGGLQGIRGMNKRLTNKPYQIEYEAFID